MIDLLLNPRRWFPVKRRLNAGIALPFWLGGQFVSATATVAETALYCRIHYTEEEGLKRFLRMERRLGRLPMELRGRYEFTEPLFRRWFTDQQMMRGTEPGFLLLRKHQ